MIWKKIDDKHVLDCRKTHRLIYADIVRNEKGFVGVVFMRGINCKKQIYQGIRPDLNSMKRRIEDFVKNMKCGE